MPLNRDFVPAPRLSQPPASSSRPRRSGTEQNPSVLVGGATVQRSKVETGRAGARPAMMAEPSQTKRVGLPAQTRPAHPGRLQKSPPSIPPARSMTAIQRKPRTPGAGVIQALWQYNAQHSIWEEKTLGLLYAPKTKFLVSSEGHMDEELEELMPFLDQNATKAEVVKMEQARSLGGGYSSPLFPPDLSPSLTVFLKKVWQNMGRIVDEGGAKGEKGYIDWIYNNIYEKGGKGKEKIKTGPAVAGLVKLALSCGLDVHLQGSKESIKSLWSKWKQSEDVGAYKELSKKFFYFRFRKGETLSRILINMPAERVHEAFEKILPLLKDCPYVIDAKVGGPDACQKKLDGAVIYLNTKDSDILNKLIQLISQKGIQAVKGSPGLTNEITPGIAIAEDPPPVGGRAISFGQKRCILAYIAMRNSANEEQFLSVASHLFAAAGIDVANPHKESAMQSNKVEGMLRHYLDLISPR